MGASLYGMAGLVIGALGGAWLRRDHPGVRALERQMKNLVGRVNQLQSANEDHRSSLDRRMRDVEASAATAAAEARTVSVQLASDTGLSGRLATVEAWANALGADLPGRQVS
jgi:hypothetical protein